MGKNKSNAAEKKSSKSSNKKELEKQKIDSDSEVESDNEVVDESDSDNEPEEAEAEIEVEVPESMEKKQLTFETVYEEFTNIRKEIGILESKKSELILEHEKSLKEITSDLKKKITEEKKLYLTFPKLYKKDLQLAKKERRKRNGENKGGFNKETEVPETLRKFLEIEEGTKLARPKVMSLLNEKFKELGLKKGQEVELDKKTAKKFGLKEGHVIGFTEFQRFIADQYPKTTSVDV
jgi:hypothetical protein